MKLKSSSVLPSLARRCGPLQWNLDKCTQDSVSNCRSVSGGLKYSRSITDLTEKSPHNNYSSCVGCNPSNHSFNTRQDSSLFHHRQSQKSLYCSKRARSEGPALHTTYKPDNNETSVYSKILNSRRKFSVKTELRVDSGNKTCIENAERNAYQEWPDNLFLAWNSAMTLNYNESFINRLAAESLIQQIQADTSTDQNQDLIKTVDKSHETTLLETNKVVDVSLENIMKLDQNIDQSDYHINFDKPVTSNGPKKKVEGFSEIQNDDRLMAGSSHIAKQFEQNVTNTIPSDINASTSQDMNKLEVTSTPPINDSSKAGVSFNSTCSAKSKIPLGVSPIKVSLVAKNLKHQDKTVSSISRNVSPNSICSKKSKLIKKNVHLPKFTSPNATKKIDTTGGSLVYNFANIGLTAFMDVISSVDLKKQDIIESDSSKNISKIIDKDSFKNPSTVNDKVVCSCVSCKVEHSAGDEVNTQELINESLKSLLENQAQGDKFLTKNVTRPDLDDGNFFKGLTVQDSIDSAKCCNDVTSSQLIIQNDKGAKEYKSVKKVVDSTKLSTSLKLVKPISKTSDVLNQFDDVSNPSFHKKDPNDVASKNLMENDKLNASFNSVEQGEITAASKTPIDLDDGSPKAKTELLKVTDDSAVNSSSSRAVDSFTVKPVDHEAHMANSSDEILKKIWFIKCKKDKIIKLVKDKDVAIKKSMEFNEMSKPSSSNPISLDKIAETSKNLKRLDKTLNLSSSNSIQHNKIDVSSINLNKIEKTVDGSLSGTRTANSFQLKPVDHEAKMANSPEEILKKIWFIKSKKDKIIKLVEDEDVSLKNIINEQDSKSCSLDFEFSNKFDSLMQNSSAFPVKRINSLIHDQENIKKVNNHFISCPNLLVDIPEKSKLDNLAPGGNVFPLLRVGNSLSNKHEIPVTTDSICNQMRLELCKKDDAKGKHAKEKTSNNFEAGISPKNPLAKGKMPISLSSKNVKGIARITSKTTDVKLSGKDLKPEKKPYYRIKAESSRYIQPRSFSSDKGNEMFTFSNGQNMATAADTVRGLESESKNIDDIGYKSYRAKAKYCPSQLSENIKSSGESDCRANELSLSGDNSSNSLPALKSSSVKSSTGYNKFSANLGSFEHLKNKFGKSQKCRCIKLSDQSHTFCRDSSFGLNKSQIWINDLGERHLSLCRKKYCKVHANSSGFKNSSNLMKNDVVRLKSGDYLTKDKLDGKPVKSVSQSNKKKSNDLSVNSQNCSATNTSSFPGYPVDPDIWKYVLIHHASPVSLGKRGEPSDDDIANQSDPTKRSILDLFRSIDKSTVIIQKDFYTKEKIVRKIKNENENNKPSVIKDSIDKIKVSPMDNVKQNELKSPEANIIDKTLTSLENTEFTLKEKYIPSSTNKAVKREDLIWDDIISFNRNSLCDWERAEPFNFGFYEINPSNDNITGFRSHEAVSDVENTENKMLKNEKGSFDKEGSVGAKSFNSNVPGFRSHKIYSDNKIEGNMRFNSHVESKNIGRSVGSESSLKEGFNESTGNGIDEVKIMSKNENFNHRNEASEKIYDYERTSDKSSVTLLGLNTNINWLEENYVTGSPELSSKENINFYYKSKKDVTTLPKENGTISLETSKSCGPTGSSSQIHNSFEKYYDIENNFEVFSVNSLRKDRKKIINDDSFLTNNQVKNVTGERVDKNNPSTEMSVSDSSVDEVKEKSTSKRQYTFDSESKLMEFIWNLNLNSPAFELSNIDSHQSQASHNESELHRQESNNLQGEELPNSFDKLTRSDNFKNDSKENEGSSCVSNINAIPKHDTNSRGNILNFYDQDLWDDSLSKDEAIDKSTPVDLSDVVKDEYKFLGNNGFRGEILIKLKEDGDDALAISTYNVSINDYSNKMSSDNNQKMDVAEKNMEFSAVSTVLRDKDSEHLTGTDDYLDDIGHPISHAFPLHKSTSNTFISLKTLDSKTEINIVQNSNMLERDSSVPSVIKSFFQMSGCSSKLKEHRSIVESAKSNLLKLENYHITSPNQVSGKSNTNKATSSMHAGSGFTNSNSNHKVANKSLIKNTSINKLTDSKSKKGVNLNPLWKKDDTIIPVVTATNDYPVINIQLHLASSVAKHNNDLNQDESKAKVLVSNQPQNVSTSSCTYEETVEKLRRKFIANTFKQDSNISTNKLKIKPIDESKKTSQDNERDDDDRKAKASNDNESKSYEYDPNSNLSEKDLKLLENYFYTKNNNTNKNKNNNKVSKKSSKYSLGKGKMSGGKKLKSDSNAQSIDSTSKFKELIEKYAQENYAELSQYSISVMSPSEFASAFKTNVQNKVKSCVDVSEETIKSFTILNHNKKDLEFFKPGIGVVNIDLFANPILKERFAGVPSVSKILNDTLSEESKHALNRWKVQMIAAMGNEQFQQFYKEQLDRGKAFHSSVKGHLMGQPSVIEKSKDSLCIKSIDWVLKDLTDIAAVESFVIHSPLGYKGIFDCVAKYKGKPVLIEWKHSSKRKTKIEATYDAPLQMTAYMGALSHDKNYNYHVNNGLIVVAHDDGSHAEVFEINAEECQMYWAQWLDRVRKFNSLNQKKDSSPPT